MDKVISKIIDDVCEKHGIENQTAELIYTDVFRFIKQTIEGLNFDELQTESDLRKAKVNFNIPRIFKLYTTPERIHYVRTTPRKSNPKYDKGIDVDNSIEEKK